MFMVASSVVTTIMVLNYHHRLVNTHDMPDWVGNKLGDVKFYLVCRFNSFPSMDPLVPKNVSSWGKNNSDAEIDERIRQKRNHPSHAKTALTNVCLTNYNTFLACLIHYNIISNAIARM